MNEFDKSDFSIIARLTRLQACLDADAARRMVGETVSEDRQLTLTLTRNAEKYNSPEPLDAVLFHKYVDALTHNIKDERHRSDFTIVMVGVKDYVERLNLPVTYTTCSGTRHNNSNGVVSLEHLVHAADGHVLKITVGVPQLYLSSGLWSLIEQEFTAI